MGRRFNLCVLIIGLFCVAWGLKHGIPKEKLVIPTYHGPVPTLTFKQLMEARQETVLISSEGIGEVGRCTGMLVSPTHVLTAGHCTEDWDEVHMYVYTYPMKDVYNAKPVFISEAHDLALLELDRPVKLKAYAKFSRKHEPGMAVTSIGNSWGSMLWFVSHGIVGENYKFYVLSDVLIMPGNSGGPWFNNDGKVVGISDFTIASSKSVRGMSGAVGSEAAIDFLYHYDQYIRIKKLMHKLGLISFRPVGRE